MAQIDRINGLVGSIAVKAPCRVATTANITLAGFQTIDGITLADGDDNLRVFVKDQTDTTENGIYDASSGTWSRSADFDGSRDVVTGTLITVNAGTANANTAWRVSTNATIVVGATALTFSQAVFSGSGSVEFLPEGAGAVATNVQSALRQMAMVSVFDWFTAAQIADIQAGTLSVDVTLPIQTALDEMKSGQCLVFPYGLYKVTDYLSLTLIDFEIMMLGIIVPTGTLNNVADGLFNFVSCEHFRIRPNIKNASYASTINPIRLQSCTEFYIGGGRIDVKTSGIDGSAVIQIAANTQGGVIEKMFLRGGYGVLVNDIAGVSDIDILNNHFVGQVAYGNAGPGDAIEINTPTNGSSNFNIIGNRYTGYAYAVAGRSIINGFANVANVIASHNSITDAVGMIGFHAEDGSTNITFEHNIITSAHIGVNIACNTADDLKTIKVNGNSIDMPILDAGATYATGAGIKVSTNQASGGGEILGLDVVGNTVTTSAVANNGIFISDHRNGDISSNTVSGFPGIGLSVHASNSGSSGIHHSQIHDNISTGNTTNYNISKGAAGSTYTDELIFRDVSVKNNKADNLAWTLDYYSGGVQAYPIYPASKINLTGNAVSLTDNTATKIFTITIPNSFVVGQVRVDYNAYNTETGNRVQESGSYVFTIGRQSGSAAKIASSAKFANSQVARIGAGAPTVTITSTAVAGAVGATNTFDIQFTYNLGAVSENNCEFEATYIGNLNTVTLAP